MLTSSVAPASASSEAGGPGSQMSSQTVSPIVMLAELDQRSAGAGLEVALLVEHAVVGQEHLAVDRLDACRRRARRRRCRRRRRAPGNPTSATSPSVARRCDRAPPCASVRKCSLSSRSSGGIAGHGQLGEQHQLGAGRGAACEPVGRSCARCRRCPRRSGSSGRARCFEQAGHVVSGPGAPRPSQNCANSCSSGSSAAPTRSIRVHASAIRPSVPGRRARITACPAAASEE